MAIVIHMHASVTRHRPYGAKEAQLFLNQVLPAAAGTMFRSRILPVLAGMTTPAPTRRCVFIRAIQRHDPRMKLVYFDATSVAGMGNWQAKKDLIAKRTREIGVSRVLVGSDGAFGAGTTPAHAWTDFRSLPLSKAEFQTIESNITPYMR